jgi:hypothetical protein
MPCRTHLGRRHDGEGTHHPVRELLPDLGDKQSSHSGTSSSSQRVSDLKSLKTVGSFSLLSDDIEDLVNKLGSLSVMTLSPVVTGSGLCVTHVVGPEKLSVGTGLDRVHGTGLQIDENGTGNVLLVGSLVEVDTCEPDGSASCT